VWGRNDQYGQPWLQSFNTGGISQVYAEHDGFGTPLGLHNAGNDFYLVLDNLGSVVAVVNTAGTVVARYSYDPYGNAVSVDESGLSNPNIVRYTGGALDQTTGLTKLGQRYYAPALGAFTQQDANQLLANPQNGNLYAYAGDSPANFIDPTGRQGQDTCSEVPTLYECSVPSIVYGGSGTPLTGSCLSSIGGLFFTGLSSLFFPEATGARIVYGLIEAGAGSFSGLSISLSC